MSSVPQLRAIIWTSVSSRPQAGDDKISLEEQERLCREWCEANHCTIVDVLTVPGHSRYESDLFDLMEDYAQRGIWAYHRIREHWKQQDFDVLVCYHDSRFARSATVYNSIVENVIRSGARIYRIVGGWIDEDNKTFQLALGSVNATSGSEQLIKGRKMGMKKRAQRGLPTTSGVPITHKLIRNEKGKAEKLVVNESHRRLFDDFVTLFLEGVGWRRMEQELYKRFGHVNQFGEPWSSNRMYRIMTNPTTWGHSAMHYRGNHKMAPIGEWIFEEGHEIPPGVTIHYNTHEPVWTGETAELLKAEFRRRQQMLGKRLPNHTYDFSGLLICGNCGYYLTTAYSKYWRGLACRSKFSHRVPPIDCPHTKAISQKTIQEWFHTRLLNVIENGSWEGLLGSTDEQSSTTSLAQVESEIADLRHAIVQMIEDQARQKMDNVRAIYQDRIDKAGERLEILEQRRRELEQQFLSRTRAQQERQAALDTIKSLTLERFWELEGREINQVLMRLMGKRRLVVTNATIVGVADAPKHLKRAYRM